MNREEKVLIMMTTYNGEKYIRGQIESIINQTFKFWSLFIEDDGSTDNTIRILEEYSRIDKRIFYTVNSNSKHGAFVNFHTLIKKSKNLERFDYYMFADQDDIWLPEKIEIMLREFKSKDLKVPRLIYADMSICNEVGEVTEKSIDEIYRISGRTKYNVFFAHKVFGCNLMMNLALFEIIPVVELNTDYINLLSHDNYCTKIAAVFGEVEYMPQITMLYRRHGSNATGKSYYKVSISHVLKRCFEVNKLAKDHTIIYNQSLITIKIIRENFILTKRQNRYLEEIEDAIRAGGRKTLKFIIMHDIDWGRKSENFSRIIILFFGWYRKYLMC